MSGSDVAAQQLFDNPAVVMPGMGGGVGGEIGFARTARDFKILFGPLA